MPNIHTLRKDSSNSCPSSFTFNISGPNPYSIIPPVVLLILGVALTIIGSLSLLSSKYHALSALKMTPEIGLSMALSGTAMTTFASCWIYKKLHEDDKNDQPSIADCKNQNGERLGSLFKKEPTFPGLGYRLDGQDPSGIID